jgi:hypothetical protein
MGKVVVYKGRRNVLPVSLGIDVSADTITSEVRSEADIDAPLIMTWTVTELTDGTDGELILTVDDTATSGIQANSGWMDLKRVTGGEPVSVFEFAVEVEFRGSVTA